MVLVTHNHPVETHEIITEEIGSQQCHVDTLLAILYRDIHLVSVSVTLGLLHRELVKLEHPVDLDPFLHGVVEHDVVGVL